jgi:glycosyltransferase involved in cell wall biosynthesis
MLSPSLAWPSTTGGQVRIAEVAMRLAQHFNVTFMSPRYHGELLPHFDNIKCVCPDAGRPGLITRLRALLNPFLPYHTAICRNHSFSEAIRLELQSQPYDVIYSHFIHPLICLPPRFSAHLVVDQHNVDRDYWQNKVSLNAGLMKLFCRWNRQRTVMFENSSFQNIWAYVSVSNEDRAGTMSYAHPHVKHFWCAPNGVDTQKYKPASTPAIAKDGIVLGYLGSMDLPMNTHAVTSFAVSILPLIRARLTDLKTEFLVIGRNPAASIRNLADGMPGIRLSGTVDDVAPWLRQVDILVAPIQMGAGTKLKVVEALACGIPVVGTSPALAGLPGKADVHYLRADDNESFADSVCALAHSPDRRRSLGNAARELAEEYLSWDRIVNDLAQNIEEVLPLRR